MWPGRTFWQTAPKLLQYEFLAVPSQAMQQTMQEDVLLGILTRIMKAACLPGTIYVSDGRIAKAVLDRSCNPQISELYCVRTLSFGFEMCSDCASEVARIGREKGDIRPLPLLRELRTISGLPKSEALSEAKKLLASYPLALEGLAGLEKLLGRWPDMTGQNIRISPAFVSTAFSDYPGISASAYDAEFSFLLGMGGMGGVCSSGWFGEAEAAVLTGVLAAQNMAAVFLKSGSLKEAAAKEGCI